MLNRPDYIPRWLLDPRDPDFVRQGFAWSDQMRSEMDDLVITTRKQIATTRILLAETDRLLCAKIGRPQLADRNRGFFISRCGDASSARAPFSESAAGSGLRWCSDSRAGT
jgi:hypothetical protein